MAKKSTDPCRAQRDRVAESEASIKEMEERIPDTPPSKRPKLLEEIKAERKRLALRRRQLTACEAAH